MNSNILKTQYFKTVVLVSFFTLSLLGSSNYVHAAEESIECEHWWQGWGKCLAQEVKEAVPDLDIKRTVSDTVMTMISDVPMQLILNQSADQVNACLLGSLDSSYGMGDLGASEELTELYGALNSNGDCAQYQVNPWVAAATGQPDPYASRRYPGSLSGVALRLADISLSKEAVPVSLAYYMKDVASQIPFVKNTAYAQEIDTSRFVGYDLILDLWKLMRNLAFGMISVFMVITGMMIIMRKQVDPRTAVTVQNAIPRIIIALVLITFSYALGSVMVGLMGPLLSVSLEPIRIALSDTALQSAVYGPNTTLLTLIWQNTGENAVSVFTLLLFIIAFVVLIVMIISVLVKMLISYIKLLSLVIIAPLQFAWGAIPGNEDSITNWFKSAAAAMLAVPAMSLGLSMGLYFAWTGIANSSSLAQQAANGGAAGPVFNWVSSSAQGLNNLMVPIFVMAIFIYSGKIPQMIEDGLLGAKKRR